MSALAQRQEAFLAAILDEDAPVPAGWGERHRQGLAIYRNNYRAALVEALRVAFERTERLVGEAAFGQAAAHHCIVHPPSSWTLDLAGAGFPETCADLFANDPDVAELAALEWAMHTVFVVRDAQPLGVAEFGAACAGFGEADWEGLRLSLVPGVSVLGASFDLVRLWSSLASEDGDADLAALESPHSALVWREGERPVFVLRPAWEGAALLAFQRGATLAEVCADIVKTLGEDAAIAEVGAMLARWVGEGLVEGLA